MTDNSASGQKRRVHHFSQMKSRGEKVTVITAYDYPTGLLAESANVDIVLVGDSLGMVALGFDSTIPVTLDMMIHHTAAVHRAVKTPFLVADLPFLTYHSTLEATVTNAGKLVQLGGAEAVKLEGGVSVQDDIKAIVAAGIPVMGHIGLQPQSVHKLGGYRVQGKTACTAESIMTDALAVQEAGAFAIVLEAMTADLAARITAELSIPTIGIGASKSCDGQVLVINDIVGTSKGKAPRFAKKYLDAGSLMADAVKQYCDEVRAGKFPDGNHEYH